MNLDLLQGWVPFRKIWPNAGTNFGSFTVTVLPGPAPELNIVRSSTHIVLPWSNSFACYTLHSTPSLSLSNV